MIRFGTTLRPMSREVRFQYQDPLDAVWLGAAARVGLRVNRSNEVFAATDGRGVLTLGEEATLDADDCLAQMIFHELCHSLVQGPDSFTVPDWGLDNVAPGDEVEAPLPAKAAALYKVGCDAGDAASCDHLGVCAIKGLGIARDYHRAKVSFRKACQAGLGRGCTHLGLVYHRGLKVVKSLKKAAVYYRKGCAAGDARGCGYLGLLTLKGEGVRRNPKRAKKLLDRACKAGLSFACATAK